VVVPSRDPKRGKSAPSPASGTTAETLREVYDDVTYEELAEAMELLRKSRRRV
jgi:hypothetical protein